MRLWLIYIAVLVVVFTGIFTLISASSNPETNILGVWEEQQWEYEKVNFKELNSSEIAFNSAELKNLIGQHLVIHMAEKWVFLPDGRLKLINEKAEKTVKWRIKGMGNILQIQYGNEKVENYNITVLDQGKLILNFDSEVQARGIAKLTFTKKEK